MSAQQRGKPIKVPRGLVLQVFKDEDFKELTGRNFNGQDLSLAIESWKIESLDLNGDGIPELTVYPQGHPFSGNAVGSILIYRQVGSGYEPLWAGGEENDGWDLRSRIVRLSSSTLGYANLQVVDFRKRPRATLKFDGRRYHVEGR